MPRYRSNPASVQYTQRPMHINTLQQANDNNLIFGSLFKALNSMQSLPNGFELRTLTANPSNLADGAFIIFLHPNFNVRDYSEFMVWLADTARERGIYLYALEGIPSESGVLVVRVYMP